MNLRNGYVIPIPYYDKNSDGSLREMHYESDQCPGYVTVTHYEEYDFENRKPDMIYIHNPYDEFNLATNVHPFFYAKNLKSFTDKLVVCTQIACVNLNSYFIKFTFPVVYDWKFIDSINAFVNTPCKFLFVVYTYPPQTLARHFAKETFYEASITIKTHEYLLIDHWDIMHFEFKLRLLSHGS